MRKNMLKTPFVLVCFVFIIYMMRQNDLTLSKGLRHSLRSLENRILDSGSRPSTTLCDGVSFDDTYSDGDVKRAEKFISNTQKLRGGNPLEDWVLNGDEDTFVDDYVIPMIPWVAPWPVLAIISLLTCIGFVSNWCCIFGCCKNCCKCCKCCKPAKQQGRLKLYMAISSFFLLCMVGCGAAGLVFSPKVTKGINVTFCSALISVEDMVHGDTSVKWLGFNGIIDSLNNVKAKFNGVMTGLTGITADKTTLDSKHTDASTANQKLYDENNGKTDVPRADPAQTTLYTPDYVANLGPPATTGTYTHAIQQELDAWQSIIENAYDGINNAVLDLNTQKADIEAAINSGITTAQSIRDSLNNVIDSIDDSGPIVKDGIKGAGYGLIGLFGVNLLFSLVAILSIAMFGIVKVKFFSKILHFSWCVINLMTILGFLLSTLTLPGSIVMMESCEIFRLTLNDQAFFEKVTSKLFEGSSSDTQTILNTCFYGTGSALSELGLDTKLNGFDQIYDQLDAVEKIIPIDDDYTTNPPKSKVIPVQQFLVNQYKIGELPDKSTTATDLQTLNRATDTSSNSCVDLKDRWMLNSINCTGYDITEKFQTANAEGYRVGLKTCIGFDQWVSPKDISIRYDAPNYPTTCTNPNQARARALVNGFVTNRAKVSQYFGEIESDLNDVSASQQLFSREVVTFIDGMKTVKAKVSDLKDSIVGETNGVIPNTNCQFVGNDLRTLQASMCTGMMASIYQAAIILIVMSVTALFATIFTFCLAKKFSMKEDKPAQVGQIEGNESAFAFKTVM